MATTELKRYLETSVKFNTVKLYNVKQFVGTCIWMAVIGSNINALLASMKLL